MAEELKAEELKAIRESLVKKFKEDVTKRHYLFRILLVLDQLLNVVIWNGSQDETVSSHIGRKIAENRANKFDKFVCFILKKIEAKHCFLSRGE